MGRAPPSGRSPGGRPRPRAPRAARSGGLRAARRSLGTTYRLWLASDGTGADDDAGADFGATPAVGPEEQS